MFIIITISIENMQPMQLKELQNKLDHWLLTTTNLLGAELLYESICLYVCRYVCMSVHHTFF